MAISTIPFIICSILVLLYPRNIFGDQCKDSPRDFTCNKAYHSNPQQRGDCAKRSCEELVPNVPLIRAGYCFNNGSGICKLLAGRYEFYYDSWNDKFLHSAPESDYVDSNGYHERLPVTYKINGDVLYVDRTLNWADQFVKENEKVKFNLLSISSFNWCAYVNDALWPYKSSIKKDKYHIYFYNRQSCVYDSVVKGMQHYNTRFLHKSHLRLDLDMNPTIFAMEDNLGNATRLVKNKRQHWYEVDFMVEVPENEDIDYFVSMNDTETLPSIIDGKKPFLSSKAYKTDLCMTDYYLMREKGTKNNPLLVMFCGDSEYELVDLMKVDGRLQLVKAGLHNIPRGIGRGDLETQFFGVDTADDESWKEFAKDGLVFSAVTTIPVANEVNKLRVLLLYADFKTPPKNKYDEYFPVPKFADYIATKYPDYWDISARSGGEKVVKELNYVDDIAYLYKCDTVLTIFGPLYTEQRAKDFSTSMKSRLGSITALGMWETTNAFFAEPDTDILWALHRTNYLAKYKYTCGSNGALVTAVREGKYMHFFGSKAPPFRERGQFPELSYDMSEEWLFKAIGVFKGSLDSPEPPNYLLYKGKDDPPPAPQDEPAQSWLYWVIGVAVLLIMAMAALCLITVRRWRKRRLQKTARSAFLSTGGVSTAPRTQRSGFSASHAGGSTATTRSAGISSTSLKNRNTVRSTATRATSQGTGVAPNSRSSTVRSPTGTSNSGSMNRSVRSAASNHKPSSVQKFSTAL